MKSLVVINDIHLGVKRMAGTTPTSQTCLKETLQGSLSTFLDNHRDKDVCINGDLFDGFQVDIEEVLMCYSTLSRWLVAAEGCKLILAAGNHDIGKRDDRYSSFDVLVSILGSRFGSQVQVIRHGLRSFGNIHIISHCMNQDLFDIELEKAREVEPGFLLLHANVDNGFAENSDHSLNVNGEWLTRLSKKHTICFAHEHQARKLRYDGKPIYVLGNQFPSSIADCLAHGDAQKNGLKYAHIIHPNGELEQIITWQREGDFVQMDWRELQETTARFVRLTGKATANEAAEVVSAVSKYRQNSEALVISNAVVIDGVAGMDELAEHSFEQIKSFDVLKALLEMLEPKEVVTVKKLLEVD